MPFKIQNCFMFFVLHIAQCTPLTVENREKVKSQVEYKYAAPRFSTLPLFHGLSVCSHCQHGPRVDFR
jgi:hypothetical protein